MKNLGIYVHIPFCTKKCNYCDFNSFANSIHMESLYVDALLSEMRLFCDKREYCIDTIFFGGGTPTLMSVDNLHRILGVIYENFNVDSQAEISIETNPGLNVDYEYLRSVGFNRLSIGLQSIHDDELKILGRIHNFEDFCDTYKKVRDHFNNINVDLIYGIPEQTLKRWKETVDKIAEFSPEHISAYSLKIEEGTPFFDMKLNLPDEDSEREMYYYMAKKTPYKRYEISNFSIDNEHQCRHNLKYWKCEEYLGFGAGAHSYFENRRYNNKALISEYMSEIGKPENIEIITQQIASFECIMLGLRLDEGLEKKFFHGFEKEVEECIGEGLLILRKGSLKLTEKGNDLSNQVFMKFMK